MKEVLAILAGAGMTVASCAAAGSLLFAALQLRLARLEHQLLAFLAGSALMSLLGFVLCAVHQARKGVYAAAAAVLVAAYFRFARKHDPAKSLPGLPKSYLVIFVILFAPFLFVYFFNAMAPEASPDGVAYHLDNVAHFARARGFDRSYDNMYYHLSQGLELLFLQAFTVGRHSAAAMVHLTFLLALPLLVLCYGRRAGFPRAGVFAGILVLASPIVGIDGVSAYNDVAMAAVLFGVFYLLQVWDESGNPKLLYVIGLLAGFGYAIKYTGGVAVPFAIGFVVWRKVRARLPWAMPVFVVAGFAALSILPWMAKNWIWTGNPVAPMLNAWFPNPHIHIITEENWRVFLRRYEVPNAWELPLHITVYGYNVSGLLGPVFLLSPLALLALRHSAGRRLLAAGLVFALPGLFNVGTRFFIPAAPFIGLAMGLAFANSFAVIPVLTIFHALLSWPNVIPLYSHPYAWRLVGVPIRAALRLTPPEQFLASRMDGYRLVGIIEREVPPGGKIFAFGAEAQSYLRRDMLVSYTSAFSNLLNDWLLAPLNPDWRMSCRAEFRFPAHRVRKVRVVQTGAGEQQWSVNEMRLYDAGRELARAPQWRLRAHPNPWEVQLAFDNSAVTRWLSFQRRFPGMYLEIDLGGPAQIDSVAIEACYESVFSPMFLEVQLETGEWRFISRNPQRGPFPPPSGLRRAATREMKARGVGYILVRQGDFALDDMRKHPFHWGLTQVADVHGLLLYRID